MIESDRRGQPEGWEECLEALYRLERTGAVATIEQLRTNPDLENVDLASSLIELMEEGYVEPTVGVIHLTEDGRAVGRRIYARHELMERVLRILGVRRARAHAEACRLEHVIKVPHEQARPRGPADGELERFAQLLARGALPLSRAREGGRYRVELIRAGYGARRRLEDLGVTENTEIRLKNLQHQGPVEIEVRGSSLALGRGIASKLVVLSADSALSG